MGQHGGIMGVQRQDRLMRKLNDVMKLGVMGGCHDGLGMLLEAPLHNRVGRWSMWIFKSMGFEFGLFLLVVLTDVSRPIEYVPVLVGLHSFSVIPVSIHFYTLGIPGLSLVWYNSIFMVLYTQTDDERLTFHQCWLDTYATSVISYSSGSSQIKATRVLLIQGRRWYQAPSRECL